MWMMAMLQTWFGILLQLILQGISSVNLFLKARDSSAANLEPDDSFESFYRIDGGAGLILKIMDNFQRNFGSVQVTQDSLSGSTVK